MVSAVSELEQLTHAAHLAADGSDAGARSALHALPWLASAIHDDRAAGRFAVWGRSSVIDAREARLALGAVQGPTALAYAVAPTAGTTPLLVTMFPVTDATIPLTEFLADPRLRWNAV